MRLRSRVLMLVVTASIVCLAHVSPAFAADGDDEDGVALQPGKMGLVIETLVAPAPASAAAGGAAGGAVVRIKEVTPGGPADKLGLRVGDVIASANGRPVSAHSEVAALLRDRVVGVATRLRIARDGGRMQLDVLVPAAPQPMLRIDAGMHNAPIRRMAVDAEGRWLTTASEDKTARVWDLRTGRLAATLRPPVGDANEGQLHAVAMAPDGATVAVAGATGQWDRGASVYLFDRASGRVLRSLDGFPARIEALAWSLDGSLLAASVSGKGGIFVYRTSNWSLVGRDETYADTVSSLDFDRRNRLVSASHDGYLRLHSLTAAGMTLKVKAPAAGGKRPATARFSPDGAAIAVGFVDSTQVRVFGGDTLEPVYAPDTAGVRYGDLRAVAWSSDGKTLYAAGRYVAGSRQAVRSWTDAGRGVASDEPVAENSIFDLRGLPGGGVLFCTAEPAWGLLGAGGRKRVEHPTPVADFRGGGQQLEVSRDARAMRFGFERAGAAAARFDTEDGLGPDVPAKANKSAAEVFAPRIAAPGMVVTGWKNEAAPKLNGVPLQLRPGENARSLSIAADGSRLALGSDWGISTFDRTGRRTGRIQAPGTAWAVNLSGDGRYLVAAFADGTVRWYATSNNQERLALFAHADRKRWVAWTPSGYYAASAAGEELVGWHVNNGKAQAGDFYPASRFRARFHRPDVLARVLEARTDLDALKLANQEAGRVAQHVDVAQALPPVIDAVSPSEARVSDTRVIVRYKVRNISDAPLLGVRVRVNGANVSNVTSGSGTGSAAPDNPANSTAERSVAVVLPERDSTVEIFAENSHGVSTPAAFRFLWNGRAPAAAKGLSTLHVLAIGISKYRDDTMSLGYPAKDARDFAATLVTQKGKLYGDIQVTILTDAQATRQAVLDALAGLKKRVRENDVGMLFIAGHGYNNKDNTYFYVPYDFDRKLQDSTGVVYSAIRGTLADMSGRAILFIDTCHAGNVLGGTNLTAIINDLTARENNVIVFASSTQKELSQESDEWRNGAFTKALVEGIRGGGDVFRKGKVMYTGLHAYLSDVVSTLTGGAQHPVVLPGGIEDFVVAIP